MVARLVMIALLTTLLMLPAGCGSLEPYPAGSPGWHSADYGIVFGRLVNEGASAWTLRYAAVTTNDPYGGKFALIPAKRLNGFVSDDQVEVFGHPLPKEKNPDATGTLYHVDAIRLWVGTGRASPLTR